MNNLWKKKANIGVFLTTVFVLLSYEVKNPLLPGFQWLLILLSFVISTYTANVITEILMDFRLGRAFILGKSWIEGYWYLKTNNLDQGHAISNDGIVYIAYEGDQHELNVFTYRTKTSDIDSGFSSVSELVTTRDFDTKFSNYFVIPEGDRSTHGITVGKFFRDGSSPLPNKFEGTVVLFSDGLYRRQMARKIQHSVVKKLQRIYGDDWMTTLLTQGETLLSDISTDKDIGESRWQKWLTRVTTKRLESKEGLTDN